MSLDQIADVLGIGDFLLSLASLFIAVLIGRNVRRIERRLLSHTLVPERAADLQQHASNLNRYLDNFTGSTDAISRELREVEATLEDLVKNVEARERKSARQLLKLVKAYRRTSGRSELIEVRDGMHKLLRQLDYLQRERSLGGS
jgi:hypothetical protein